MKVFPLLALSVSLLSPSLQQALASDCIKDGFLPPNSLSISSAHGTNGMTEQRFNALIDRVEAYYKPIVAQKGASLMFEREWADGTVNAYASRNGNQWIISMYGGLARHQAINEDGFTLVACHEVGHHLGGAPKYRGEWAANEGQADYFGVLKCLRNIFEKDDNVSIVRKLNVPASVTSQCEAGFGDANSIAICQRSSMAGRSTAELMRVLGGSGPINFETPDANVVSSTQDAHPAAQCRLDTYFNGSVCQVGKAEPLSDTDPTVGTCSEEKNYKTGVRPRCWYKPEGSSGPGPSPSPTPPSGEIARAPTFGGQTQAVTTNPYQAIPIEYDVSNFTGAAGIYFEVTKPNQTFSQPNSTTPDSNAFTGFARAGARGQFFVVPAQHLPGWGSYQMRLIPLDQTGKKALGKFSNASTLVVKARTWLSRGISAAYPATRQGR
jgi:hypothetical protein